MFYLISVLWGHVQVSCSLAKAHGEFSEFGSLRMLTTDNDLSEVVYLEAGSRKHWQRMGEVRPEGEAPVTTVDNWNSALLGCSG